MKDIYSYGSDPPWDVERDFLTEEDDVSKEAVRVHIQVVDELSERLGILVDEIRVTEKKFYRAWSRNFHETPKRYGTPKRSVARASRQLAIAKWQLSEAKTNPKFAALLEAFGR